MLSLALPLGRAWIEARLPHQGRMCLLDEVVACDAHGIRCLTSTHRAADNPLRVAGRLGAVCAIEYAAQAMALHGAALQTEAGARFPAGMLASVRGVDLMVERLDLLAAPLQVECVRIEGGPVAMLYRFSLQAGGELLAQGRASVVIGVTTPMAATREI